MRSPDPPNDRTDPDQERFAQFYRGAYLRVLRFTMRRLPADQAEDLVAEAFLIAWRRLDELPADPDRALAWTLGVARNLLLSDGRAEARRRSLLVRLTADAPPEATSPDDLDRIAARTELASVWHRLRPEDQEVLALTYWDDLTSGEAATVLSISPVAVRLRLTKARRNLRRHLDLAAGPTGRAKRPALRSTS